MTINTQVRSAGPFLGAGAIVVCPFTFKVFAASDLVVTQTDADGTQTDLTLSSDFTVSLNADQDSLPGGTVTTLAVLDSGVSLTLTTVVPATQGASLTNLGGFLPKVIEGALDRLTILIQQVNADFQRTLRMPEVGGVVVLPPAAERANKLQGYNNVGAPLMLVGAEADSATALQLALAASTVSEGAALVTYLQTLAYAAGSVGYELALRKRILPSGEDDGPALQALVDELVDTGGQIEFIAGKRYKLSTPVTISSLHPIALVGAQSGQAHSPSAGQPTIELGAVFAGDVITYTAPNSGARSSSGGGLIRGLTFIDPTGTGGTPGTRTVNSVLKLNDFITSLVEDCTFQWIAGTTILGEYVVMSSVRGNVVRYCGAVGQPALSFPSTDPANPAQSLSIFDNRLEVCHGAAYIALGASTQDCKVVSNGFEAETTLAASNQLFITCAGDRNAFAANHFQRNTGGLFTISGNGNTVTGNTFTGGAYATTSLTVSGARNTVTGNAFASTRTGLEVLLSGRGNTFVGNTLYFSGAVRATGSANVIGCNSFDSSTCTTAVLGAGEDWWISDGAAAAGTNIGGNTLINNGGTVTTVGGIRVKGTAPNVHGNTFDSFAGTGNGALCIRVETTDATVGGNVEVNSTTLLSTSGIGTGELYGNHQVSGTTALPLTGTATYNPASLADGDGATTTVTCTGAALGDFALASFSLDLQGVSLSAWVSSASVVSVRFQNETGGVVDLASGTIKVRAVKR